MPGKKGKEKLGSYGAAQNSGKCEGYLGMELGGRVSVTSRWTRSTRKSPVWF